MGTATEAPEGSKAAWAFGLACLVAGAALAAALVLRALQPVPTSLSSPTPAPATTTPPAGASDLPSVTVGWYTVSPRAIPAGLSQVSTFASTLGGTVSHGGGTLAPTVGSGPLAVVEITTPGGNIGVVIAIHNRPQDLTQLKALEDKGTLTAVVGSPRALVEGSTATGWDTVVWQPNDTTAVWFQGHGVGLPGLVSVAETTQVVESH